MIEIDNEWIKGKDALRDLGNSIAPVYDKNYGSSNFSTGLYMQYEASVLREAVKSIPKDERTIALDIGSGTGKYAFMLGKYFEQSRGYDFSEVMVKEALKTKYINGFGGVSFELRDVEERLLDESDSSVALVCVSFGMGSYVSEIHRFLREIRRLLRPQGILVISFYNSNSIVVKLKDLFSWKPSLAAKYDSKSKKVEVNFEDMNYHISAKAYSYNEIKNILSGNFKVEKIISYPTLSSLLPNDIFHSVDAQKLCQTVDSILANNEDIAGGPYILAVCRKGGEIGEKPEHIGYERITSLFKMHNIRYNPKEHAPIVAIDEIELALSTSRSNIAKVVVFVREKDREDEHESKSQEFKERGKEKKFFAVVHTADRKVHLGKFLRFTGSKKRDVRMASQQELEDVMGFQIHNMPPFGFPKFVVIILDESLYGHEEIWCGVGKRNEHILLKLTDLKMMTSCSTLAEISKKISD